MSLNIQVDKVGYRSDLKNNNSYGLAIKKFELYGHRFFLTQIVNVCETHHLYKNRYYDANTCETIDRIYDV